MPQFSSRAHDRGGNLGGVCSGGVSSNNNNNPIKKKFGKNLNHALSKPTAAPPIPSDKSNRHAKNGLLLLSTKKSSAGLLASKTNATISPNTNAAANGIIASSGKTSTSLNLQSQSNPTTHQVLLSAVVGAAQMETHQKLDAWGVADQIKEQRLMHYDISQGLVEDEKFPEQENESLTHDSRHGPPADSYHETDAPSESGNSANYDDQGAYMARLAKERARIKAQEDELSSAEIKARTAVRLKELELKKNTTNGQNASSDKLLQSRTPEDQQHNAKNGDFNKSSANTKDADDHDPTETVIHLSSYEDRDRGERGSSSAPRMLFDPKSGSMVEVKAKAEPANNNLKQRKERRVKPKKERETVAPVIVIKNGRNNNGKPQKTRKEVTNVQYEKKKANPNRRLPRTRGLLYRRDGKGNLRSVDECGPDLGFGAHSVPGGRIRNPEAYSIWNEQSHNAYGGEDYNVAGEVRLLGFGGSNQAVKLDTGFVQEQPQPIMEWVKPEDKIELITGVDDSPTLKPTAKEFAPSSAALAAAAAAASSVRDYTDDASSLVDVVRDDEETEDEEESDEHDDHCLVFDPILHGIDFMGSPGNTKSPEEIATADLPPLGLDTFSASAGDSALSRPLFSFGSSAWGSRQVSDDGLSGWGASSGVGLFGTDVFRQNGDNDVEPHHFLASVTSTSWGPTTVPGLERLPTINATEHVNGSSVD